MMRDCWPQGMYLVKRHGLRSWYNYWYTKLFINDEGGEFDLKAPLYRRMPQLARWPYKVEIEHTTVCDKKCIFCAHTHWNERQKQLSFDEFRHILDSIPRLKWVNIAGIGSMFLNKDVGAMLRYASDKKININFVDEFDYLTGEQAWQIIEMGVNSIYVSFDAANKGTYEMIKRGCDYDTAVRNLNTLLDMKAEMKSPLPVVHFRYLINKLNYQEMPDYVDFIAGLKNRGTRARLEFIGLIVYHEIEKYYMPLEGIPEDIVIRTYENAIRHGINLHFTHTMEDAAPVHRCTRWSEPFILVTGEVIPCCAVLMQTPRDELREHSFGNVFGTPFMQIWRSKRYKEFRRMITNANAPLPVQCKNCCVFDVKDRMKKNGISS